MEKITTAMIGGKELSITTGKIAKQASGSVIVQYGETRVIVTAVASKDAREVSFLPLTVEYQERIYAAGRIPGNYFRREIGRPSENETLRARMIDRPIRPLFEKGYNFETQVIATVLSTDKMCDPGILAIVGASAALEISDIPFNGPIAGIKVGRVDGQFIANPTPEQMETSDIDLTVAGSKTGVVMVEGGADVVSEKDMLEAIFFGHEAMQPLIDLQIQLKKEIGKEKRVFTPPAKDEALEENVMAFSAGRIHEKVQIKTKIERANALGLLKEEVKDHFAEQYPDQMDEVKEAFSNAVKSVSRKIVLTEDKRIDGRAFDEIRQIDCEAGCLPRLHGSALFTRGETQVLGVLTLGSGRDEQRIETLNNGDTTRAFMLHYNFPPFSVGEVKRAGGPSRRDVGHGDLAHRALSRILPSAEEFEYTIRLVGEVMESNGSSSMGTVCAGTLALMDGGVPIKAPVSGIAMGLVKGEDKTVILSDILGDEDHFGDMDFKVAGTTEGITALQMDIKIKELSKEIMETALNQARGGRLHILAEMMKTLDKTRENLSPLAPKIVSIQINKDKIRDIIGPGGKVIRAIQTETNTVLEVDDSGLVKIAAENQEDADRAMKMVGDIAMDPEIGAIYQGEVVKITDFGAFVNIKPGTDGLVHISELAEHRVKQVTDVVKEGEIISVKVLDITRDGKIKLSYKAAKKDEEN
ncbi:MAG: polyribonucleotide nucleotidyltransferase [Proteobacteria bacterium]|nr:polyribonucleotide nucleotidyltransferase [Desulfobacula sp.]MBU3952406.1 polyribonucleotide nucleotidyltransferase [Pseudomonadota bacterium]MBU4130764.1 polyribonucleotide nucleotidyltransferase [Pseudomonadota bacterium]